MKKLTYIYALVLLTALPLTAEIQTADLTTENQDEKVINGFGYYTSHIAANHVLHHFTENREIEIEDGSIFAISPLDHYKLSNWYPQDALLILQGRDSEPYRFRICNQRNRSTVEADFVAGPIIDSMYKKFIVEINYYGQYLVLNDGSRWRLHSSDYSMWRVWQREDTIIVGTNGSFFNWSNPNILINFTDSQTVIVSRCEN
jgi:hypothetical protein